MQDETLTGCISSQVISEDSVMVVTLQTWTILKMLYKLDQTLPRTKTFVHGRNQTKFLLKRSWKAKLENSFTPILMRRHEPWEEELKLAIDRLCSTGIPTLLTGFYNKDDLDTNPEKWCKFIIGF